MVTTGVVSLLITVSGHRTTSCSTVLGSGRASQPHLVCYRLENAAEILDRRTAASMLNEGWVGKKGRMRVVEPTLCQTVGLS